MQYYYKLNLQLFGEGAGDGGGGGASTGDNATAVAGQESQESKLLKLGVPADKLRKRAQKPSVASETKPQGQKADSQVAADSNTTATEDAKDKDVPTKMSWDDIMADPEYNKKMQEVVSLRLKKSKSAEEAMGKLAPSIEILARKYGLDQANMDYDALNKAINDDDSYYEDKALEMGVDTETAKKLDQKERETARRQQEEAITLEQQRFQQHITKLEQQGEAMKATFPGFDLRKELQNPAFARMTSPNVGISVEDAYYAVHRNEIQTASMQVAAQKSAQKLSNSIQSGQRRPDEAGTSGQAPSVTTFDYRNASREQREALKKQIRDATARGEKLYPGR